MGLRARCPSGPVDVALVVGGRWHDNDYARRELLAVLGEHDAVRCTVHADFSDSQTLAAVDAVIAYTCDVRPTAEQVHALRSMVRRGGRLLGLHATNSAIDAPRPGEPRVFRTPRAMPEFTELLGNRFIAHPKIGEFLVEVVTPDHPLVADLPDFTTTDEVYVSELSPDLDVLLDVGFTGECPGFEVVGVVGPVRLPVLFTRPEGDGVVTYFTLGHCRGRFDLVDQGIDDLGEVDRVAWESSEYREVLRRTVAWAVHGDDWTQEAA